VTHSDRRDFGVLALLLLAWGLLAAPLLHTVEHAHGHRHHHKAAPGGNLEHFSALALVAPTLSAPILVATTVSRPSLTEPDPPWLTLRRLSAEPQGP
jgi:hypothetical protein